MSKPTSLIKTRGRNTTRDAAAPKRRRPVLFKNTERKRTVKRAEDMLKESEEKYRSLFEQTMDAVMITDMETGIILEANGPCSALFGYTREKLNGMPHHALLPADKKDGYAQRLNARFKVETAFSNDMVYLCADGKEIKANVSTTMIVINGKRVIQSIFREMTERNSLLKKTMGSEEKFSRAFNASPDAMSISDLTDGKFIEVNESYLRITGYTREELINQTAADFNMWATPEDRKKMIEPLLRQERLHNAEVDFRIKNGGINTMLVSTEYIQISGRPCVLVVSTDITEYKRTKKALVESEQQLARVFRLIPQAIVLTRMEDGRIIDTNDYFHNITGYTREESIGCTVTNLGLWENQEDRKKMVQTLSSKNRVFIEEYNFHKKSGEVLTGLLSAEPIEINGEQCLIAIITDITERKRIEKALKESEEKFSRTFHALPESISISRVSDGVFIDVNRSFCRQRKLTREEIIGHTGKELGFWEAPGERERIIREIQGKMMSANREYTIELETGEKRTSLLSADIVEISGEPFLIMISKDITDRKRMEEALKVSEDKFSKAFRSIPESIAISRVSDGVILDANDNFCRIANRSYDEIIGRTDSEINLTLLPGNRDEDIKTIKEKGGIKNREMVFNANTGTMRAILFSADIIDFGGEPCVISISTDITERKRMEEALANEAIRHRILIEQSTDGIVIIDENGAVHEANLRFSKMIGYSPEETLKLYVEDWEYLYTHEKLVEMLRTVDQSGDHFETKHRRKDGSIYDVEISTNGAIINGKKLIFCVCRDITERKRMERSLADEAVRRRILTDQSRDGIVIIDQTGAVYEANHRFAEMHGYNQEEILKLHIWDWEKSLPREKLLENIQIRDEKGANFEARHCRKDGSIIDVEVSSNGTNYAGQKLVFSVIRDISERKRMEQMRSDDAVRRRILIEQSRDGIVIMDQAGAVYEANHRFAEMHGYAPEEITKLHIWDWEKSLPQEQLLEVLRKRDQEGVNFETRHYRKDGSIIDVEVSSNGTLYAGQKLVFSVVRDISERKRMEQALRESEEKFSKAFQIIPEAISISRLRDGLFVDVNNSFCRRNDLTREEIIGHTPVELGLMAQSGNGDKDFDAKYEKSHLDNVEFEFKLKNGEIHTVLVSSDVFNIGGEPYILSIGNDITDRKRMEQTLRESEEKFSKAFHAIPESVSIATVNGGIFLDVNESFLRSNNLTREQVIGHSAIELKLWNNPVDHEGMVRSVKEHGNIVNDERQFVLESGDIITLLFSASITKIAGEPCIITIANNITSRKHMEEQLKKALAELQSSAARLKATNKELESFSYSVSHDLRSPLRSIDGFSQALLEDYSPKLDETARDYLNRMRSASQKMGELIDGLLKLSRLTRNDMHYESVDLSALVQDIAARLQETDPERKAEFVITPGIKAAGDAQMLRVMLENLVGNAWKFTRKVPQARIEFGSSIKDGMETFFIKDNGAGFDMAYRDKLFSAFQRLHDTQDFPGAGIGLATVQRIINRHGGTIRAEGVVGRGAAFYFNL